MPIELELNSIKSHCLNDTTIIKLCEECVGRWYYNCTFGVDLFIISE